MPVIRKQSKSLVNVRVGRKSGTKAPGTRNGTLEDWRGASGKNDPRNRRHAFRDGR